MTITKSELRELIKECINEALDKKAKKVELTKENAFKDFLNEKRENPLSPENLKKLFRGKERQELKSFEEELDEEIYGDDCCCYNDEIEESLNEGKRTDLAIQTVFTKNNDKLFAVMQSPSQFGELKKVVSELLDSPELKDNDSVEDAKLKFMSCEGKYRAYIGTLITYLTGQKV